MFANLITELYRFDILVFHAIYNLPHTLFISQFAGFLSGIGDWGAIWFILAIILFIREESVDHWIFLPLISAAGLSYLFSELVVKPFFARPRPFELIMGVFSEYPNNYSFPSTHTTVAFALAVVLAQKEPKFKILFYILAILISLSRIYLGVHFPSDIAGGIILGSAIGIVSLKFADRK